MMRKRLLKLWREAKLTHSDPVDAWASIVNDPRRPNTTSKFVAVAVSFVLTGMKSTN
nr:hypothetical protein PJ912_01215 [Pectobacterium colocasium]